jgi:endonuclease IV
MQNKLSKEDKSPTIKKRKERKKTRKRKKEERNEEKKNKDYRLIAHGPYLRKFLICLKKEKPI